jgi:uncharacterized protein
MRNIVEFNVEDGTKLHGYCYEPDIAEEKTAGIVMMNGFSGVKESLTAYAELFCAAGMRVLLYDNRNFGESSGELPLHIDPHRQVQDLRYAITFLQSLDGVDPERIGMFGTSLSGGHAIVAAATDRRIKCVVSQSPLLSGPRTAPRFFPVDRLRKLEEMFVEERARRRNGDAPRRIPVLSDQDELMCLPPRVSKRFMDMSFSTTPNWKNEVTLQSLENFLAYEPGAYIKYVSPTPLLIIAGNRDTVCFTDLIMEAYAQALEPKNLVILPAGHWGIYFPPAFEQSAGAACDWFIKHLSSTEM